MVLQNSLDALSRSGAILFPSDTVLGLGCDATNQDAVNTIFLIKNRPQEKSLIALVAELEMLTTYVETIPQSVHEILKGNRSPTTIVYPKAKGIAPYGHGGRWVDGFSHSEKRICTGPGQVIW